MTTRATILVVDDDPDVLTAARMLLKQHFARVLTTEDPAEIEAIMSGTQVDVFLVDMNFAIGRNTGAEGLRWLERILALDPDAVVVLMTAFGDLNVAVRAMREGAADFVLKPWQNDKLVATLSVAAKLRQTRARVNALSVLPPADDMVATSKRMREVLNVVSRVAPTEANVLIRGENGTGKELIARAIHYQSNRTDERFLAFNCGAFTEELLANELFGHEKDAFTGATSTKIGLLETANRGTVFLDEIGDMPASMQVKLLRVIEERSLLRVGGTQPIRVDIRIVAATNKDLTKEVEAGRFRKDLFYRLNVVSLHLPPLSERKDDIPLLAYHFLKRYAEAQEKVIEEISDEAMNILINYEYPGNIRELENIVERAVALCNGSMILSKHLPQELEQYGFKVYRQPNRRFPTLEENEIEYICWVLKQVNGNKTRAAEVLGIDRVSLWRKLKRSGLTDSPEDESA